MGDTNRVRITLEIENREIVNVSSPNSDPEVTRLTPEDHRKFKHSAYGLRPAETVFETQITESEPKCYMIIGGFKVRVPCS
jgi:hypothetical protein